jgi:hypothetical protein
MSTVLEKPNKTLFMVLSAIPLVNIIGNIALFWSIYQYLETINPETKRGFWKDFGITIITCGLFGLVWPYLLIKDTVDSSKQLGIEVPNYAAQYYGLTFGVGFLAAIIAAAVPDLWWLGYVIGFVTGPLAVHFFLDPFSIIADAYNS